MANSAVSTFFLPAAERYGFATMFATLGAHILVVTLVIAVWLPETANHGLEHIESLVQSRSDVRGYASKAEDTDGGDETNRDS